MPPPALAILRRGTGAMMPRQGGRALRPGAPGCRRGLSRGVGSPHHDTLSPRRGEPAVPAPPATHTVISAGRAEASVIIGGDSLALERRMPGVQQDFPARLVCRASWYLGVLAAAQPCGAGLALRHRSGAGAGRGHGGERCHRLRFVPQHAPDPPPLHKRHGCGLASGRCRHRR